MKRIAEKIKEVEKFLQELTEITPQILMNINMILRQKLHVRGTLKRL